MRSLSPRVLRDLRDYFRSSPIDLPRSLRERWVAALEAALAPKKSAAPAKKRRAEKKATHREEMGDIRRHVLERAKGRCEFCGVTTASLEVDHMFGGANRRTLQSVFTCWALCRFCHLQKTANTPNAAHWLRVFREHCRRHQDAEGYVVAAGLAEARLDSLEMQGRAG